MQYIVLFNRTSAAVKAEQCLLSLGLDIGVLPVPTQIRAGCGICLRVDAADVDNAVAALAESGIADIGLFSREESEGGYIYTEITDRNE